MTSIPQALFSVNLGNIKEPRGEGLSEKIFEALNQLASNVLQHNPDVETHNAQVILEGNIPVDFQLQFKNGTLVDLVPSFAGEIFNSTMGQDSNGGRLSLRDKFFVRMKVLYFSTYRKMQGASPENPQLSDPDRRRLHTDLT